MVDKAEVVATAVRVVAEAVLVAAVRAREEEVAGSGGSGEEAAKAAEASCKPECCNSRTCGARSRSYRRNARSWSV